MPMLTSQLFLVIMIASVFSFGGLGSLPVLQSQLQANGVAPDAVVLPALAVGNISPGPNGLYLIAASYFIDGIRGALVSCVAVLIPPFLVIGVERASRRLIHLARFRAMLRSLALAVVALLVVTDWSLVKHAVHVGPLSTFVMLVGTAMLVAGLPPLTGVVFAIAVGVLIGFGVL
jgi:chromate transporter